MTIAPEGLTLEGGLLEAARESLREVKLRAIPYDDPWTPREAQRVPKGEWRIWGLITGRGWGKNRVQAEFAHHEAYTKGGSVGFIAGRTLGDVIRTVLHHPRSGIMTTMKPYNPCELKVVQGQTIVRWKNGSRAEIHTSEEPDRARGPEYDWGIADEVATWKRTVDFQGNTTWENLQFGLRGGRSPRMVAGTTPRRGNRIVKELIERASKDGSVRLSRGSLLDNRDNLPESYVEEILHRHGGTTLGRQEIEGQLLEDIEGALITREMIERDRLDPAQGLPVFKRVAVGVDPSGGREEQGIVVAARGVDDHGYVLRDVSGRYSPDGWGRRTVELYRNEPADVIVAERNYGGDMVENTLKVIDPFANVKVVTASRGKAVRAEPIAALYEQRRIHHLGLFEELEDELTAFVPGGYDADGSPNRADALVWALSELFPQTREIQRLVW